MAKMASLHAELTSIPSEYLVEPVVGSVIFMYGETVETSSTFTEGE
jgi:hypothetical protein